jgi:hypothetical protein
MKAGEKRQIREAEFAKVAGKFCRLIEGHRAMSREAFQEVVLRNLSLLYAVALQLRSSSKTSDLQAQRMTHAQWEQLFKSLGRKLGTHQRYWVVFNPQAEEKPLVGNLADDLADIYRDLKPGLLAFARGRTRERAAAVWAWHVSFLQHWGHHAASAIRVLHELGAAIH